MKDLIKTIEVLLKEKIPMSLTIHFDGHGNFKLESKLGDKATKEVTSILENT